MTADGVPGWVLRRRARERRRERCRRCNHKRVIQTEYGPYCEPHAELLPPPITYRHHDHEEDQP